jgi:uncharacterized hydrophobic protein (TIGR00271 family)
VTAAKGKPGGIGHNSDLYGKSELRLSLMTAAEPSSVPKRHRRPRDLWEWLANRLGITRERKEQIYAEVSRSASLDDPSYWLQILFSAGIATLGLALNSPAVIIGAMLISPLMGPILAAGLALAAGDFELGARAFLNLVLSCLLAVLAAAVLVSFLPFKEITPEIAARVRPTTLDLFVALLSGGVGSVAICKEVKGVATSIPGVAIAVALMPPLCVAGYGLGVAVSLDAGEGLRVARGGGLLFFTNLVAITLTAMLVYLALRVPSRSVRERVRKLEQEEGIAGTPAFVTRLAAWRVPGLGSLSGRILLVFGLLLVIWHPLSQSFDELRTEVAKKREENRLQHAATTLWQKRFASLPDGRLRSYLGPIVGAEKDGRLTVEIRVFTSRPYTAAEKAEFQSALAQEMHRAPESLVVELVEVPTASAELEARKREAPSPPPPPPTPAELEAGLLQIVDASLRDMRLPPPAELVDYRVSLGPETPMAVEVSYLSDRDIEPDAQFVIADDAARRIGETGVAVRLGRIAAAQGPIPFRHNKAELGPAGSAALDAVGRLLRDHPALRMEITAAAGKGEPEGIGEERAKSIEEYLAEHWQIAPARMSRASAEKPPAKPSAEIRLVLAASQGNSAAAP